MDLLDAVPTGPRPPNIINVIIEIAKNSQNKYEYLKEFNVMKLDRVIGSHLRYPANYGFVPQAISRDNDLLDALVITHEPVVPGILIEARPVGLLKMKDGGKQDNKILCIAMHEPRYKDIKNINDIAKGTRDEISHFFQIYKKSEGIKTKVEGWFSAAEARKEILLCMKLYREKRKK